MNEILNINYKFLLIEDTFVSGMHSRQPKFT